jgi:glycosyltransferase involved in cell wall biosynthesis
MKLLMLAEIRSVHTLRWATALAERGINVTVFSIFSNQLAKHYIHKNITVYKSNLSDFFYHRRDGSLLKLFYLYSVPDLKRVIRKTKPDLLHAHYASSYGVLGALSGAHPLVISVWGNDVYEFPRRSYFHQRLFKYALSNADKLLSTSNVMAGETRKYTNKSIEVTPFGIDISLFKPGKTDVKKKEITIGTVKSLEEKYGIEYLLRAFSIVRQRFPALKLKLLIVGGGSLQAKLENQATQLGIRDFCTFTGKIDYLDIPKYHSQIDIAVFPSIYSSESFGVAVLEASACAKPVIVSRIGGLTEVVEENITGLTAEIKNPESIATAISTLIKDPELRKIMGQNGRKRVAKLYNFSENVDQMVLVYKAVLKKYKV